MLFSILRLTNSPGNNNFPDRFDRDLLSFRGNHEHIDLTSHRPEPVPRWMSFHWQLRLETRRYQRCQREFGNRPSSPELPRTHAVANRDTAFVSPVILDRTGAEANRLRQLCGETLKVFHFSICSWLPGKYRTATSGGPPPKRGQEKFTADLVEHNLVPKMLSGTSFGPRLGGVTRSVMLKEIAALRADAVPRKNAFRLFERLKPSV